MVIGLSRHIGLSRGLGPRMGGWKGVANVGLHVKGRRWSRANVETCTYAKLQEPNLPIYSLNVMVKTQPESGGQINIIKYEG